MGDLEGLPFGASPAITTCARTLDHIDTRYEFVSTVFTQHTIILNQAWRILNPSGQTESVLFNLCIQQ